MTSEIQRASDLRMDMGALLRALLKRWLRVLLVTVLLVAATGGGLMFVPKTYESSASLLVEPRDSVYTRAAMDSSGSSSVSADAMMSSQIELIKSRDLLLDVVNSEGLRSIEEFTEVPASPIGLVLGLLGRAPEPKPVSDQVVLANLADHMTVVRERDSAVITITVRSADPVLAARIANAIAAAHVKRRAAQSITDTAEATVWLQQEIDKLRAKVEAADSAVAKFKVDNDLFLGANAVLVTDQQISTVSAQIADAQQRRNDAQSRADLIRGLVETGQSLEGVADVRNSVVIQSLLQTKATLQGDLAQKSSTLLANHPTIKALRAQVREIEGQIAAEGRRVAESLDAEATIQAGIEARLRADLDRAKVTAGSATKGGVTLDGLEREAKVQRDLLENYLARYSDATSRASSNSALPDVRIVSEAAPSNSPAAPKIPLIVGAVAFVSLALQVGGILFGELMSGRALVERPRAVIAAEATPVSVRIEPVPNEIDAALMAEEPQVARLAEAVKPLVAADELAHLSTAMTSGQVRILLLSSLAGRQETLGVIDRVIDDALTLGLSAVAVDAGSGEVSSMPGISDLAAEAVEYGDVVYQASNELAQVPWGRLSEIDPNSTRPRTLVEALADIYHVVVVDTGMLGPDSSLGLFDLPAEVALVTEEGVTAIDIAAARHEIAAFGFETGYVVRIDPPRTDVA